MLSWFLRFTFLVFFVFSMFLDFEFLFLFLNIFFIHFFLGICAIFQDYLHQNEIKIFIIFLTRLFTFFMFSTLLELFF
uniref:Succinate dehydrogenase subunit 4 n=1 Tax=Gredgaria maugeana TaxID=2007213 RepID=UPI0022FD7EAE|nr:Succinate dehydrogenase subunit 4 [Gredgaria maugeana]WAX04217.1 Succinate dehydrogenase subunit 4 [Gredgaria maugeana]